MKLRHQYAGKNRKEGQTHGIVTCNLRKSLLYKYLQIACKNSIRKSNYLGQYFNTGN